MMTDKVFDHVEKNPEQALSAKCEHCGLVPERNIWAYIVQKRKNDFDFELVRGDLLVHALAEEGFDHCFVQWLDIPRDCNAFFRSCNKITFTNLSRFGMISFCGD
jgi:hypothetical protein